MNKVSMIRSHIFLAIIFVLSGCSNKEQGSNGIPNGHDFNLAWKAIDSLNTRLPDGLEVFAATNYDPPLRAWYARVNLDLQDLRADVLVSTDTDRRETVAEFAERTKAPLLINGGYFRMDLNPADHVGVLKVDDQLIQAPTPSVLRESQSFKVHRAAIGLGDSVSIGWISGRGDSLKIWDVPIANAEGKPGRRPARRFSSDWNDPDILGGGPLLIRDAKIHVAWESEVFFGTSIPNVHPRTAAGMTADNELILLVVDGRQSASRGVDLYELARILEDLGCVDALNLDGGGSSTMIVNGVLLNRPAGGSSLREVMSALAVQEINP